MPLAEHSGCISRQKNNHVLHSVCAMGALDCTFFHLQDRCGRLSHPSYSAIMCPISISSPYRIYEIEPSHVLDDAIPR